MKTEQNRLNSENEVPLFPGRRRGKEPVGVNYYAKAETDEDAARRLEAVQAEARKKLLKAEHARASQLCEQCVPRGECFICGARKGKGIHGHMWQHIRRGEDKEWLPSERSTTGSTTTT